MTSALTPRQRARAAVIGMGLAIVGDRPSANVCFRGAFTGQWEGSERRRERNRPGRRLTAQDTDLNWGTRELIISEARVMEQNFPITRHIRTKYADYCVGKCKVKWQTGMPAVDKLYQENWENFHGRADINAVHTYPTLTKIAVGSMVGDGDIFSQFVDTNSYLQLRVIEADRISSNGNNNADTPDIIGGILLQNGRPQAIRVWNRNIYGTFTDSTEIAKPNWIHLFNSKRIDAYRGVSAYHAILNQMRDFKETSAAEQTALKINSKLALLHKVITGQAPATVDLFGGGQRSDSSSPDANKVGQEELEDGTIVYRYPGEDMKAHISDRPGQNWIAMMEFIVRQIAIGVDLPFGVLWHMAGMGKPAILVDLQAADRTFQGVMNEIEWKWHRPIIATETAKAIAAKRIPFNANWWKFIVGRPAPISIDAGRDSVAALNENRMGMRSARSWFFESEEDWEEEVRQTVTERKFLETECALQGVDPNNVRVLGPNVTTAPAEEPPQPAGKKKPSPVEEEEEATA